MKKINCIIVDDEQIAREILVSYVAKIEQLNLLATCKNVSEAMLILEKNQIDLILLDINMPTISGMSFAKALDKKIKIIFTTAYREYAIDGFAVQAVDYLLKPIRFERFQQAINTFLMQLNLTNNTQSNTVEKAPSFLFVRANRKMLKIDFKTINYIESLSDYIKIITKDTTIITRETISSMEQKLPKKQFLRIHRSYIVSLQMIDSYTSEFVEINKKALPISRSYKEQVLSRLNQFS